MDRNEIIKLWIKKVGIGLLAYLAFIILFRSFFIKPRAKTVGVLRRGIEELEIVYRQYQNPAKIAEELQRKKEEVIQAILSFEKQIMPKENLDQTFLEGINKICKESKVRLDTVTPHKEKGRQTREYEKHTWKIAFSSRYSYLKKFLNKLENGPVFFGIENLGITSGRMSLKHKVEMDLYVYTLK